MWVELKKQLESNNIKFLISSQTYQEKLEDSGEYFKITSEELADRKLPYGQTEQLIKEAVELTAEYRDGKVKLTEPRSGLKDRIVCLSYGNYISSKIENKYLKNMNTKEINFEEINLVW